MAGGAYPGDSYEWICVSHASDRRYPDASYEDQYGAAGNKDQVSVYGVLWYAPGGEGPQYEEGGVQVCLDPPGNRSCDIYGVYRDCLGTQGFPDG